MGLVLLLRTVLLDQWGLWVLLDLKHLSDQWGPVSFLLLHPLDLQGLSLLSVLWGLKHLQDRLGLSDPLDQALQMGLLGRWDLG